MEEKNISGIYKITNTVNGKFYIGSSKNIKRRWLEHKNQLQENRHANDHLQRSWNKYGADCFCFEIIEECEEERLLEREQYYIDTTCCCDQTVGYNIMTSATMSEIPKEVRSKISRTLTGKYIGENCFCSSCTEDQIKNVIKDLMNPQLKLDEIAKRNLVSKFVVCNVFSKCSWAYLTKNIVFPYRDTSELSNVTKLNKEIVEVIIIDLLNGLDDHTIGNKYNVHRKTISDIRHHKTWKKYTEGYDFPKSDGLKRGSDNNMSKLTIEQVKDIKQMIKNEISLTDISKLYNVSIQAIAHIKNGKAYSYVE